MAPEVCEHCLMTKNTTWKLPLTGIDVRKALLERGFNPGKVDEDALRDHINNSTLDHISSEALATLAAIDHKSF
jgi:hypothetical protein